MSPKWQSLNSAALPDSPITPTSIFALSCNPKTDIWRRSTDDSVFSAPVLYQSVRASQFRKLSATVFGPWRTQYDQGGVIIAFPGQKATEQTASETTAGNAVDPPKWIKAGIEYFDSAPVIGVVGCDRLSDWSLCPMRGDLQQKVKIVIERKETTVWVYAQQEGAEGGIKALREIKWAFGEGEGEDEEVWVGVYSAKPTPEAEDEEKGLEVRFEGVEIEVEE